MIPLLLQMAETTPDPDTVTPGPLGFALFFFVVVAVILLAIDMVRRIRRTTYRAEISARLEEEVAQAKRDEAGSTPDQG
ncbi:hypothetical protein [Leifsonia sp. A12D58]|uniref:hypothetical protein n=1 Tax=Leifsonia sp. A12D58 TaxID=3397674 RepID=UPI0039E02C61